jgi:hypothetical protein
MKSVEYALPAPRTARAYTWGSKTFPDLDRQPSQYCRVNRQRNQLKFDLQFEDGLRISGWIDQPTKNLDRAKKIIEQCRTTRQAALIELTLN